MLPKASLFPPWCAFERRGGLRVCTHHHTRAYDATMCIARVAAGETPESLRDLPHDQPAKITVHVTATAHNGHEQRYEFHHVDPNDSKVGGGVVLQLSQENDYDRIDSFSAPVRVSEQTILDLHVRGVLVPAEEHDGAAYHLYDTPPARPDWVKQFKPPCTHDQHSRETMSRVECDRQRTAEGERAARIAWRLAEQAGAKL